MSLTMTKVETQFVGPDWPSWVSRSPGSFCLFQKANAKEGKQDCRQRFHRAFLASGMSFTFHPPVGVLCAPAFYRFLSGPMNFSSRCGRTCATA